MKISTTSFRILLAIYIATVLFLCFGKFDDTPQIPQILFGIPIDKVCHFVMFIPLPVLTFGAFCSFRANPARIIAAIAILAATGMAFAALTEFGQGLTDYRSQDITDLYADMVGLAFGTIITIAWIALQPKR